MTVRQRRWGGTETVRQRVGGQTENDRDTEKECTSEGSVDGVQWVWHRLTGQF